MDGWTVREKTVNNDQEEKDDTARDGRESKKEKMLPSNVKEN